MTRSFPQLLIDFLTKWQIHHNRLVTKDGHCNIEFINVRYRSKYAYMLDIWTTLVEISWAFVMFFFVASFLITWFVFGLLWYWIARDHGDLAWQHPVDFTTACVVNVTGMTTAFLYSLETQTFIAYGWRAITSNCPSAITVYVFQVILGTIITCFWGGVVTAKIALPKRRAKAIMFSEMAVICANHDALCLKIRVANIRKSLMIGTQIYGKLIRTKVTPEGETVIMDQVNIDFSVESGKENMFFISPLTLYHVIDKTSPFFEMAVDNLHQQDFELVVFLDSVAESTSFSCQVRTSYVPREIMWGYQFLPIISRSKEGKYRVDFSNFARVVPTSTSHCAYCFYNINGHPPPPRYGACNEGFEMTETSGQ
ncbi:ATP-sensitive inward rectifier potassium channel 1 [Astyanax mexicanus]|uniref:ATP-sensitive inward rectifier potassium channel 1-like n=1 Tax=Astyanax mexicanus TaxID=7994 RepID=A0A8B9JRP4_ASTMX|nr:ATP-sensitive inward rectifier potassium channel 1 [Astyanax mexicanus]KAG9273352.1 ATP-sensitive inward rectifier potassium channel 1-like [Astyanax mexicanus]